MSARHPPIIFCCAAAIALSACQTKEAARPAAEAAAAGAADANLLRVTAADFAFGAPDTIPAGVTTIRMIDNGPSLHHVQMVRLDQGKTMADFLTALKAGGPPPAWAVMVGGPNAASGPGDSSTAVLTLEPGNYAMICLIPGADGVPHVMKGMAHAITVAGPAGMGTEPTPDVTVTLSDYDFQPSQPLTAGHHVIRVENAGTQWHELVFVQLNPGKSAEDFAKWTDGFKGPPPGTLRGGSSGIMPGQHLFALVDLSPGDYGLICFFPDVKDGKPHFLHGMIKTVKIA